MAARLDVELAMSIAESATMMAAIIHLSSPRQARMLPPQQSSSGRCLDHQLWKGGKPTGSCMPFLSVPRCSRPKAPRLDDIDPSPTSPLHRRHTRRRPWST
jgi:hypothetical protein